MFTFNYTYPKLLDNTKGQYQGEQKNNDYPEAKNIDTQQ